MGERKRARDEARDPAEMKKLGLLGLVEGLGGSALSVIREADLAQLRERPRHPAGFALQGLSTSPTTRRQRALCSGSSTRRSTVKTLL